MVTEELLWVLWQHVLFDVRELKTSQHEQLLLKHAGYLNTHAGPDFNLSHLQINDIDWRGDVEIHVRSSDWYKHHHQNDPAYESVILHVVYIHDKEIFRRDGTLVPVLELKDRISGSVLHKYKNLMQTKSVITCAPMFQQVDRIKVEQMKQRVLAERLLRKTEELYQQMLRDPDWKKAAGLLIFKSFGAGLNDLLFERIAFHVDFSRITRLSYSNLSLEALFFGLSGMLELPFRDDYARLLQKEFAHLKGIYSVLPSVHYSEWKFMRTRPVNFPTIRLAQLAAVFADPNWFNLFTGIQSVRQSQQLLQKPVSTYWENHYRFDFPSAAVPKQIGEEFITLFMINAVIPYKALHARYHKNEEAWEEIMAMLEQVPAENNRITREWKETGMLMNHAYDSQSCIELTKLYCTHKKCLSCSIGHAVLKNESITNCIR